MNIHHLALALALLSLTMSTGVQAQPGEATCRLTFDATWSRQTHPVSVPPGPHFSGLIGGAHNDQVHFWAPGELASPGIQAMAELGRKSPLRPEVEAAIAEGTAARVIAGGGIGLSPDSVSETFRMTPGHPLITVVAMIAPSPDWFVGVRDLCLLDNGAWIDELVVQLLPYDAGTDSGGTFTSPNRPTSPPEPISRITETPFRNTPPLGTFTITCESELISFHGFENGQARATASCSTAEPGTLFVKPATDCTADSERPECQNIGATIGTN